MMKAEDTHQAGVRTSRAAGVPFVVQASNAAAISVVAILVVQVFHEACHGVASVLVGARWTAWNLCAVDHRGPGGMNRSGERIIAGNAAIMNILFGVVCGLRFSPALFSPPGQRWSTAKRFHAVQRAPT